MKRSYFSTVLIKQKIVFCLMSCISFMIPILSIAQDIDIQESNSPFYGASSRQMTITGDELRQYHPTKLLSALELADPSLVLVDENQLYGSDPNHISERIEIRGSKSIRNSVSDMNKYPLFLVDGYEVSIDRLSDFDMQRVEKIVILKNASETAILGLKSANGAVLISTTKPKASSPLVTYNFEGWIQNADLSSYNLMDGKEKLEIEKAAGVYTGHEELYEDRLSYLEANGSVNWLKIPVKTSFSQRHRLNIHGGDESLRYGATLLATPGNSGVMDGSKRDLYSISTSFQYNIANKLYISNELLLDMNNINYSSHASLLEYALMNPYYSNYNKRGTAISIVGEDTPTSQVSPFYESSLGSFSKRKNMGILDNLQLSWQIIDHLKFRGSFTFTWDNSKYEQFYSPNSILFDGLSDEESSIRGSYQMIKNNTMSYEGTASLDYLRSYEQHTYQVIMGTQLYSSTYYTDNYTGVGLSSDHMGYISFAQRYALYGRPGSKEYYDRLFAGFIQGSYDYDSRYQIGASFRLDKSSRLAPENRLANSWGVNAGWNLHNESFLKEISFINKLVLQAGYGANAGLQFDYGHVNPTYSYDLENPYLNSSNSSSYTVGLPTLDLNNPYNKNLKWRTDRTFNIGLNAFIGNRIQINFDYYNSLTDNLVSMEKAESTQKFETRYTNGASMRNSGFQFGTTIGILKDETGNSLNLIIKGVKNKNELISAPDYFIEKYNESSYVNTMYHQLALSNDVNGIYAIPSKGIDKTDGKEIFIDRNGNETKAPTFSDMVYEGSSTPDLKGLFGLSASYKNWHFNCMMSYSVGGKIFNMTKALRIDGANIINNGPKELADKWMESNKDASYQGFGNEIYPSSRFVETNNMLSLSSVYVGYQFEKKTIKGLRIVKDLHVGLTGNDLFYNSSVDRERGWIYPYARTFTLSLQATF